MFLTTDGATGEAAGVLTVAAAGTRAKSAHSRIECIPSRFLAKALVHLVGVGLHRLGPVNQGYLQTADGIVDKPAFR